MHWVHERYWAPGPQGNDIHKTNVPNLRMRFRYDNHQEEARARFPLSSRLCHSCRSGPLLTTYAHVAPVCRDMPLTLHMPQACLPPVDRQWGGICLVFYYYRFVARPVLCKGTCAGCQTGRNGPTFGALSWMQSLGWCGAGCADQGRGGGARAPAGARQQQEGSCVSTHLPHAVTCSPAGRQLQHQCRGCLVSLEPFGCVRKCRVPFSVRGCSHKARCVCCSLHPQLRIVGRFAHLGTSHAL